MNAKKQKLLIEYAASSPDVFGLCAHILRPEYFDPSLKNVVSYLHSYYEEYNVLPDSEQVLVETDVELSHHELTRDKVTYCSNEIEAFCKHQAIKHAILSAANILEKEDYGQIEKMIRDAITVSLHREIGIDFFDNVLARLESRTDEKMFVSTGYAELDDLIGGGLMRRTMTLFQANSGGGKSMTMANLAVNFVEQGLNCLYLSLELYEDQVDDRFVSMVTGISPRELTGRRTEAAQVIESKASESGKLFIKYLPSGSNTNKIRSYLKEFELHNGFVPDVILMDYLDLLRPNEKISDDNVFERDKLSAEQFRNLLVDYNMIGITASQQNRDAVKATHIDQSHIAGGLSKINTVDNSLSIIFNEVMMAKGQIAFQAIKTRNSDGVGKTIYLGWKRAALRIVEKQDASSLELRSKSVKASLIGDDDEQGNNGKLSLLELMNK